MSSEEQVPSIVHQVWLGGEPLPPILGALVDGARWKAVCHLWQYRQWAEADLVETFGGQWPQLYSQCCHLSQASDVARYLVLERFGGLYLDTDVELFDLPRELYGAWIAGAVSDGAKPPIVNGCCLAAPPGHPYIRRMLAAIERGQVDLSAHMAAGPPLAGQMLGPDVNIWPVKVWHGKRGQPGALGHHYGWGPKLKSFLRAHGMPPTGS